MEETLQRNFVSEGLVVSLPGLCSVHTVHTPGTHAAALPSTQATITAHCSVLQGDERPSTSPPSSNRYYRCQNKSARAGRLKSLRTCSVLMATRPSQSLAGCCTLHYIDRKTNDMVTNYTFEENHASDKLRGPTGVQIE